MQFVNRRDHPTWMCVKYIVTQIRVGTEAADYIA
jgi:hypothetical protein